ncbi:TPA: peptidylprolyl isomerase [Candidatus Micrarchaeota archaeon]|nr:peptidylprolyl isomerase [Candidatus Micrarchaeota archaeon]
MKAFLIVLLVSLAFALFGCTAKADEAASPSATAIPDGKAVKSGDVVQVDYVGSLTDGTLFDTSVEAEAKKAGLPLRPAYEPLEFTVGTGQMIAGFDAAVVGMHEGKTKIVTLPPEQGYGPRDEQNVLDLPLAQLQKAGINASVGLQLQASNGMRGTVIEIANENATVDFNHELAGKALVFKITLLKIVKTK